MEFVSDISGFFSGGLGDQTVTRELEDFRCVPQLIVTNEGIFYIRAQNVSTIILNSYADRLLFDMFCEQLTASLSKAHFFFVKH